jgi:hypothetical protein
MKRLLLAILLWAATFAAFAQSYYALPWGPRPQFVDANGAPMVSGTLTFQAAGSSTPQNTYTTATSGVANSNPLTLNSRGEPTTEVWLLGGSAYKVILKDSAGATVWTVDNVSGVNDVTSQLGLEWVASGLTPTFVSTTSFTLAGDQTTAFHVGRRLKTSNTGGTIYSTITASAFGALTTVTVVNDSGTLDSGLSAVSYGLLSATNTSVPLLSDAVPFRGGSSDRSKRVAIEVDGLTTNTTRTITMPDVNVDLQYSRAASDTQSGAIEIATLAEVQTGTSSTLAVTPSTLQQGGKITLNADDVVTTSGTTVALATAIPSWARRITLVFNGVSTNGTDNYLVQVGAGSISATSYVSESGIVTTVSANVSTSTAGFIMAVNSASASTTGVMTLTRGGTSFDNPWVANGVVRFLTTSTAYFSGVKVVGSNPLTHISITTTGGANTFDAGVISVLVE